MNKLTIHKMKKGIFVLSIGFFCSFGAYSQFSDNLSDGEFNTNPAWIGDDSYFVVEGEKLRLRAPTASNGKAFLSTQSKAIYNSTWEFVVQLDFNPSSSNYAKIFLVSDNYDFNLDLHGYFVSIGNTTDEVSLFLRNGSKETKIIQGESGRTNLPSVTIKIKVTRNSAGLWSLYSDVGISGIYVQEGQATDNTFEQSSYFGVQCFFTSTRSDKFTFDDFVVTGTEVPDTQPPELVSTTVLASQILLTFSESLDFMSSENIQNYRIANFRLPTKAQLQEDGKSVLLTFDSPFTNGLTYLLKIENITDLVGNIIASTSTKVLYFKAVPTMHKDIIISEIFADPAPKIGLPEGEYIEIYNRSINPIDLVGWKISDGTTTAIFPSQIVLPGEYWIVISSSVSNSFLTFDKLLPLSNFPTINNSGESITLKSANDQTIDSLRFNLDWYRDADKQMGGWSLELIDPENLCGEEGNWLSSENELGGTPGAKNSIFANKPDLTPPRAVKIFLPQTTAIEIDFDEKLSESLPSFEDFVFSPAIKIDKIEYINQNLRQISIKTIEPLKTQTSYSVEIHNVRDCSGNVIIPTTLKFGVHEVSIAKDVVINEILINPKSGGSRFVEIFNTSPKYLNLKNWKMSNIEVDAPVNIKILFEDDLLLAPNSYLVFASDPLTVAFQYPQSITENLYSVSMPPINDNEGSIAVLNENNEVLDMLFYSKSWHSPWVKDVEGVSLERINIEQNTNDSNNWTSASSMSGLATPGFANSQHRNPEPTVPNAIRITPEAFSPSIQGLNFTEIEFNFDGGGWAANVKIYDFEGNLIKTIANNVTLSSQGIFRWEGDMDNGSMAQSGYYLVWFQVFNPQGAVTLFRKRVVILR